MRSFGVPLVEDYRCEDGLIVIETEFDGFKSEAEELYEISCGPVDYYAEFVTSSS